MATKTEVKEKPQFKELNFSVQQFPGCCGIGVISGFRLDEGSHNWHTGRTSVAKKKYLTLEEQADACYKKILKETWGDWDSYSYLQIALVSHYSDSHDNPKEKRGQAQYPELQEKLIAEGWTIQQVFINPNHGNEITVYSKYFPERDKYPMEGNHDDDDDDF